MRPIPPGTGEREFTVTAENNEHDPIVAVIHTRPAGVCHLTRWTMTPGERERIARGEDIYVDLVTHGHEMQPLDLCVGPPQ